MFLWHSEDAPQPKQIDFALERFISLLRKNGHIMKSTTLCSSTTGISCLIPRLCYVRDAGYPLSDLFKLDINPLRITMKPKLPLNPPESVPIGNSIFPAYPEHIGGFVSLQGINSALSGIQPSKTFCQPPVVCAPKALEFQIDRSTFRYRYHVVFTPFRSFFIEILSCRKQRSI